MKPRSFTGGLLLAASLALTAAGLRAQDGLEGALPRANPSAPQVGSPLAVADFDNDKKADGAVIVGPDWTPGHRDIHIEVYLSGRQNTALTFESSEAVHSVSARDIDNDGDADLVVEEPFTAHRLHVWLNDGKGGFQKGRVEDFPSPPPAQERLRTPSNPFDLAVTVLPPHRSSEVAPWAVRRRHGRSLSAGWLRLLPEGSLPAIFVLSAGSPRAPPFLSSH